MSRRELTPWMRETNKRRSKLLPAIAGSFRGLAGKRVRDFGITVPIWTSGELLVERASASKVNAIESSRRKPSPLFFETTPTKWHKPPPAGALLRNSATHSIFVDKTCKRGSLWPSRPMPLILDPPEPLSLREQYFNFRARAQNVTRHEWCRF